MLDDMFLLVWFLGCIFTLPLSNDKCTPRYWRLCGFGCLHAKTEKKKSIFTYFNYPVLFGAGVTFHPSRYY
jgi:hypothetical protein